MITVDIPVLAILDTGIIQEQMTKDMKSKISEYHRIIMNRGNEDIHGHNIFTTIYTTLKNIKIDDFRIMPVKIADSSQDAPFINFDRGIEYILHNKNVKIINISYTFYNNYQLLAHIIADNPQVLFIVCAGNDSKQLDKNYLTYNNTKLPNLFIVGSSDENNYIQEFSNYGECVDYYISDNKNSLTSYTSYSAAKMSAYCYSLIQKGYDIQQIRQILDESCLPNKIIRYLRGE